MENEMKEMEKKELIDKLKSIKSEPAKIRKFLREHPKTATAIFIAGSEALSFALEEPDIYSVITAAVIPTVARKYLTPRIHKQLRRVI